MMTSGWMMNFPMRRVEPVVLEPSPYNRFDYAKYRGPKRTYMLSMQQVYETELEAMQALFRKMIVRYAGLSVQTAKYRTELDSVKGAIEHMERSQ